MVLGNLTVLFIIVIVAIILSLGSCSLANDVTLLKIPQGTIQGKILESRDGRPFYGFMGIPYAQTPKRFQVAELPPPSWDDTYDATNYKEKCLQFNFTTREAEGTEDCLYINVFTPNINPDAKLSILAFIHGGGFQFGLAYENGPEFFMDHDVVLVTFSYRVGPLGFLSTEDEIIPGNLGLKDQNLALTWIAENINYFGGDKTKVSLFGESAGSASVSLHILSPLSKGLFRHAILQSGTSLDRWPIIENAKAVSQKLANKLDCPIESSQKILECLNNKPGKEIVKVQLQESILDPMIVYGPVIERDRESSQNVPFITDYPRNLYDQGRFSKVPIILTFNDIEGLLVNALAVVGIPEIVHTLNNDWTNAAATAFLLDRHYFSKESIKWATKKLREFYFGSKSVGQETLMNLTNLFTDSLFSHKTRQTALLHAKYAPVYVSTLAFKGIWSQTFALGFEEILGTSHADDLQYFFTDHKYPKFPKGTEIEAFSKLLVQLWVNFANTGDPKYELNGKQWLPIQKVEIDTGKVTWLHLQNDPEFLIEPLEDRMKLWDLIERVLETGVIPGKDEL